MRVFGIVPATRKHVSNIYSMQNSKRSQPSYRQKGEKHWISLANFFLVLGESEDF